MACERWQGTAAPRLWLPSAELAFGGDGAAEPCAPPSSYSAWPCCGAADLPIGWNRERLMGLWTGGFGWEEQRPGELQLSLG